MTLTIPERPKAARPLAAVRREPGQSWYRITNQADAGAAEIWLYDEIGAWGISAGMFVAELTALQVLDITLHINSPGGEVWDGLAIYNALREHPAKVTVRVDGAALSAASFIAMAGDKIVTAAQSQWMIHEASGLCVGNCDDMTAMAAVLDQLSQMIADIYHDRAKGGAASWRKTMREEKWYTAQQAVDAGLADEIAALPKREQDEALAASAQWDLTRFAHPERAVALARPAEPVAGPELVPVMAPPTLEPPAVVAPAGPAAAGPRPTLDLGRMRAVVSRAAHVPFDLDRFRDAVGGATAVAPAAEARPARAFPATPPLPPVVGPVPEPMSAGRRLAAAVAAQAADAPAPEPRTRPAATPAPIPAPPLTPAAPVDPAAGNRASLRAAIGLATNDTPAPPQPAKPVPAGSSDQGQPIDIGAFRRALRGATL